MQTANGALFAMPHAYETDDRFVLLELRHTEDEWLRQVKDRFDVLYHEAERYGGRIMSLPLHAWVMGIPSRIGYASEALEHMLGHHGVWAATGSRSRRIPQSKLKRLTRAGILRVYDGCSTFRRSELRVQRPGSGDRRGGLRTSRCSRGG